MLFHEAIQKEIEKVKSRDIHLKKLIESFDIDFYERIDEKSKNTVFDTLKESHFLTLSFEFVESLNYGIFAICIEDKCFLIACQQTETINNVIQILQSLSCHNLINSLNNFDIFLSDGKKTYEKIQKNLEKDGQKDFDILNKLQNSTPKKAIKQAKEEIKNFLKQFHKFLNNISKIFVSSMGLFIIRRFYYPSTFFKDPSFFNSFDNATYSLYKKKDFIKLRLINDGSSASVYLYLHIETFYLLIAKILHLHNKSRQKYKEIIVNVLYSPFFNKCFGYFESKKNCDDNYLFEFLSGGSFRERIKSLTFEAKLNALFRILHCLLILHTRGYIHSDLTPDNILFDHNGKAFLSDCFKIEENNRNRLLCGCLPYYSPEVIIPDLGPISTSSDIYSLGMIIYFMITMKDPFERKSPSQIENILKSRKNIHHYVFLKNDLTLNDDTLSFFDSLIKECTYLQPQIRTPITSIIFKVSDFVFKYYSSDEIKKNNILKDIHNMAECFMKHRNFLMKNFTKIARYLIYIYRGNLHQKNELLYFLVSILAQFLRGYIFHQSINREYYIKKYEYYANIAADLGHTEFFYHLGFFFFQEENVDKAIYYLEKASENGCSDATCYLGLIYGCKSHQIFDLKKSLNYLLNAANAGNKSAAYNYAKHIFDFYMMNRSNRYMENRIKENAKQDILHYFTIAADQGVIEAQSYLGMIYYEGEIAPRNIEKSLEYLNSAAFAGSITSLEHLGQIYMKGGLVKKDVQKAIEYYKEASKMNSLQSHISLAQIYFDQNNYKKAKKYFSKSASQNDSYSQFFLGKLYMFEGDINNGIKYFSLSASNGNLDAMFTLAELYLEGGIVPKNEDLAIKYYKIVESKTNNLKVQYNLGVYYYEKQLLAQSKYYFEKAAKQSNSEFSLLALHSLAQIYLDTNDIDKSISCLERIIAVESCPGDLKADSYSQLGSIFQYKNQFDKAIRCYKMAASLNHQKLACFKLGILYYEGKYVKQNFSKAKKFLKYLISDGNSNTSLNDEFKLEKLNSLNLLGIIYCYLNSIEKADFFFSYGVRLGSVYSEINLAIMFDDDNFLPRNDIKAYDYYINIINNKSGSSRNVFVYSLAYNYIGLIYLFPSPKIKEYFITKNYNMIQYAKDAFLSACNICSINSCALNNLGVFFFKYEKNESEAIKYLTEAAAQDLSLAKFNLGFLKESMCQNQEAINWYEKACNEKIIIKRNNDLLCFKDIRLEISTNFIIKLCYFKLLRYYITYSFYKPKIKSLLLGLDSNFHLDIKQESFHFQKGKLKNLVDKFNDFIFLKNIMDFDDIIGTSSDSSEEEQNVEFKIEIKKGDPFYPDDSAEKKDIKLSKIKAFISKIQNNSELKEQFIVHISNIISKMERIISKDQQILYGRHPLHKEIKECKEKNDDEGLYFLYEGLL